MYRRLTFTLVIALSLIMVSCSGQKSPPVSSPASSTNVAPTPQEETSVGVNEEIPVIGISEFVITDVFQLVKDGFYKALEDNGYILDKSIQVVEKSPQGDFAAAGTIASQFQQQKVDGMFVLSTPNLQAVYTETRDEESPPIVFTVVQSPYAAGVAKSPSEKPDYITGVSTFPPTKEQLLLIKEIFPDVTMVGVVYNSGEANSKEVIDSYKKEAANLGLEIIESVATRTDEVATATSAAVDKGSEVLILPNDNLVFSAIGAFFQAASSKKVPVIGSDNTSASYGAVASLGQDFYTCGYQSGELMVRILKGEDPKDIPIELPNRQELSINLKSAQDLQIALPPSVIERAANKYEEISTPSQSK